jgi:hypothetical protein
MLSVLLLALSVSTYCAAAPKDGTATAAFRKFQDLTGDWTGKDDAGMDVRTRFEKVAGGTAVMETLNMSGMEEMVTLYSVDGDGIALVHFCPTNNQPRMRAAPTSPDIHELTFAFQGATNLPDLQIGHEQKMVIQFKDNDNIVEHWTWRKNGKDTEMIYTFTRKR